MGVDGKGAGEGLASLNAGGEDEEAEAAGAQGKAEARMPENQADQQHPDHWCDLDAGDTDVARRRIAGTVGSEDR